MCLAVPVQVLERTEDQQAIVESDGVRTRVSLALLPDASPGDYVVVHAGFAISRLDPDEAERTLALFARFEGAAR